MSNAFGRDQLAKALGFSPSDEQWEAISAPLEPGVIVAGAGTGKTTSMSARVAYLVGTGQVAADRVLGLTFTNKAAAQLLWAFRTRTAAVSSAQGWEGIEPTVSTYHAFAGRVVSEFGMRIGREPDATLLTDSSKHQRAYSLVCGAEADGSDGLGDRLAALGKSPVSLTEQMLALDGELSEVDIEPESIVEHDRELIQTLQQMGATRGIGRDIAQTATQRIALAQLVTRWREYKERRDLWDYSDHIRLARDVVRRFPEVAAEIRRRYDIVLLDEYQDTSIAQRGLLQAIFADGFPVTAVGDPCQAIYGWRGASVDNIESFPDHFPKADGTRARRYSLSENRRSGPAVLHVANEIATDLRAEHEAALPLVPAEQAAAARVEVALFETIEDEVDYLAHAIRDTHLAAERLHAGGGERATIAVLCTTGADIRRIDSALVKLGVPTQVTGAAALLADPAVTDLRALLEVVHEPTANASMVRLLTGARWRVGARDLAALGGRASDLAGGRSRVHARTIDEALEEAVVGSDPVDVVSLADALADPGDSDRYSPQALAAFADIHVVIETLRMNPGESVVDVSARAMAALGVDIEARVNDPSGSSSAALADFLTLAAEVTDSDPRIGLGGFLARLRDAERFDVTISHTRPAIAGAVSLMTVYAAKGLEFASVFVPFVSDGAFPGGRNRGRWTTGAGVVPWPLRQDATPGLATFPDGSNDSMNKQHERYLEQLREVGDRDHERLAYVGLTRAECSLTVTGHWWGQGQASPRGPHRFLTTIAEAVRSGDPDLCRIVTWAPAPEAGAVNPVSASSSETWPQHTPQMRLEQLERAANAVRAASADTPESTQLTMSTSSVTDRDQGESWHHRMQVLHDTFETLRTKAQQPIDEPVVRLGAHVGATTFLRALTDPDQLAVDLLRPMPREPSPAAARGIAWHAWVETVFGQQSLWGTDDLPGAADSDIASDEQLERLKTAFERTRYAAMHPIAVERAFSLVVGGRVINGRIDAVFDIDGRFEVVDWKTGSTARVDPRQLAVYRLAWARMQGVDWRDVDAAFVMVATGEELRPNTDNEVLDLVALN